MYNATRQIIVNGMPVDISLATVPDLEGLSLIATFTSPLTGKSYALIEKLNSSDGGSDTNGTVKIEESLDNICLRACKALFEREDIVTHVLYKDYLLSRTMDESATTMDTDVVAAEEQGVDDYEATAEEMFKVDESIRGFLASIEKHRRFNEYLKRSGRV